MKSSALLPNDTAADCPLDAPGANVAHGIVSQAVLTAPGLRVTRFHFAAGQELSEHTSPARVLVQALAGAGDFIVSGRIHALRAGTLLHVPPGLPHAVRATADLTLLLIQATPPEAKK